MKKKFTIKFNKEKIVIILSFAIGFLIQLPIGSKIIGYDINKKTILANLIAFLIISIFYIGITSFIDYSKIKKD